jgi:uncharacterized protein (DUF1330 family)
MAGTVASMAQQSAAPALYVAMLDVRDAERFRTEYAVKVPDTLGPFGGRILAGGGRLEAMEGEPLPGRPVIIQFPSLDAAKAWYASEAYAALRVARQATAGTRSFVVEGRPPGN